MLALMVLFFALWVPALFLLTDLGDNFTLLKNNIVHLQQLIRPSSPETAAVRTTTVADTTEQAQLNGADRSSTATPTTPAKED